MLGTTHWLSSSAFRFSASANVLTKRVQSEVARGVVVFTVRGEKIRPITGWDADRRTKKMYFSERGT